eukprot:1738526-Prymnesium_polylepis.3
MCEIGSSGSSSRIKRGGSDEEAVRRARLAPGDHRYAASSNRSAPTRRTRSSEETRNARANIA